MNIPNSLTLGRIVLVPLVVWLIITDEMLAAFFVFGLAGATDAADGFLAKRYGWRDITIRFACDRTTAWRRWQRALQTVADQLNGVVTE